MWDELRSQPDIRSADCGSKVLANYFLSLACTLVTAVLIIASFNFYISVAKDLPFRRRFAEMAGLSLGVATLSFLVGLGLRHFLGVEV